MQKYKRLVLVVITCLSFVLMFTYRQKYSKLSLIFEMMNAFQCQNSETKYNDKLFEFKKALKSDFGMQEQIAGMPYWTEIFPDVYVYSTYWMHEKSRSIIFAKDVHLTTLSKIECKLHYEYKRPNINTKSNIIILNRKDSNMFVFFECLSFNNQVPHSISFVYKNVTAAISLPIISGQGSYLSHYAVCMQPLAPVFKDVNKVLEFIIYHSDLGIKLFIFYETGLSVNVRKLLTEIAMKNNVHILLLQWNVPFNSQTDFTSNKLYFLDCIHRVLARNHSDFIFKLELSDFIVPETTWSVANLDSFDSVDVFMLHEKVFCEEYPSDVIAQSLFMPFVTLLKTRASNENKTVKKCVYDIKKLKQTVTNSKKFLSFFMKKNLQNAYLIPDAFAVLHSYRKCGLESEKSLMRFTEDRSMWKYKDMFFQSHLYLLAKGANLTDA